jgi:hypothetical protein
MLFETYRAKQISSSLGSPVTRTNPVLFGQALFQAINHPLKPFPQTSAWPDLRIHDRLWPCLSVDATISSPYSLRMANLEYLTDYDQIVNTMQMYIDGSKQGKSELMRPAFHPDASFFGYAGDQLALGTPFLFDWIDKNGPADKIEPRVVSVDILESIAAVRLDVHGWSGNLAGSGVYMSDLFTLLKTPTGWKIIQKAFHWHS